MGEVLLGMPGPWAEDYREKADHYTTKIGGLPDWPILDLEIRPELLHCSLCGGRLCLVTQVYAPILLPELNVEERVIYIFGCPVLGCGSDPRSWRALRIQKFDCRMQSPGINPDGMQLEDKYAKSSKANSWLEELLSINGSGKPDYESDNDLELQDLALALAEASSLASSSKKKNGPKHSGVSAKRSEFKPEVVDVSAPVLPCFYVYSEKERSPTDVGTISTSYSLSLPENESTASDHETEEKWEGETYEYDKALGADRTYLKFKKRLDAYPEQCFRYSYRGNPLVATNNLPEPDNCKKCGSSRSYEMQLMPQLLYFLQNAADGSSACSPDGWNWMTLVLYTCTRSCCPPCDKKIDSCCWGLAEEAIIIHDE